MGSKALLMSSSPGCVCVCVYNEADSSRVGIRGQSSLYAVCRAPRQKHCWAVKHSVTKTTCSRVEDRQTQAGSAAPHQELVPYHQGLRGSFLTRMQHSRSTWCIFYLSEKLKSRTDCPWQICCGMMRMGVTCKGKRKKETHLVWHILI